MVLVTAAEETVFESFGPKEFLNWGIRHLFFRKETCLNDEYYYLGGGVTYHFSFRCQRALLQWYFRWKKITLNKSVVVTIWNTHFSSLRIWWRKFLTIWIRLIFYRINNFKLPGRGITNATQYFSGYLAKCFKKFKCLDYLILLDSTEIKLSCDSFLFFKCYNLPPPSDIYIREISKVFVKYHKTRYVVSSRITKWISKKI